MKKFLDWEGISFLWGKIKEEFPDISEEELTEKIFTNLHQTVLEGFDSVKQLIREYITKNWKEEDGELDEKTLEKRVKKELGRIKKRLWRERRADY